MEKNSGGSSPPLPGPPSVPENVNPELADKSQRPRPAPIPKYSMITRQGVGTSGRCISLLTNHFKVSVKNSDAVFYQYSVCLFCYSLLFLLLVLGSMSESLT